MAAIETVVDDFVKECNNFAEKVEANEAAIALEERQKAFLKKENRKVKSYLTVQEILFYKNISKAFFAGGGDVVKLAIRNFRWLSYLLPSRETIDKVKENIKQSYEKTVAFFTERSASSWLTRLLNLIIVVEAAFLAFRAYDTVSDFVSSTYETYFGEGSTFGTVKNWLTENTKAAYENIKNFTGIDDSAFETPLNALGRAWEDLKEIYKQTITLATDAYDNLEESITQTLKEFFKEHFNGSTILHLYFNLMQLGAMSSFYQFIGLFGFTIDKPINMNVENFSQEAYITVLEKEMMISGSGSAKKYATRWKQNEAKRLYNSLTAVYEDFGVRGSEFNLAQEKKNVFSAIEKNQFNSFAQHLQDFSRTVENRQPVVSPNSFPMPSYVRIIGVKSAMAVIQELINDKERLTFEEFKSRLTEKDKRFQTISDEKIQGIYNSYIRYGESVLESSDLENGSGRFSVFVNQIKKSQVVAQNYFDAEEDIYMGKYNSSTFFERQLDLELNGKNSMLDAFISTIGVMFDTKRYIDAFERTYARHEYNFLRSGFLPSLTQAMEKELMDVRNGVPVVYGFINPPTVQGDTNIGELKSSLEIQEEIYNSERNTQLSLYSTFIDCLKEVVENGHLEKPNGKAVAGFRG